MTGPTRTDDTLSCAPGGQAQELARRLATPVEALVREHGGEYTLYQHELGLLIRSKDLASGYAELRKARDSRLRELAQEGVLHWLPTAGAGAAPKEPSLLRKLTPTLLKAAIATSAFLFCLSALSGALRDAGYIMEKKLEGLSNWTPEQVEWHRARSEKIAAKLGPTIRELLPMFREAGDKPAEKLPQPGQAKP